MRGKKQPTKDVQITLLFMQVNKRSILLKFDPWHQYLKKKSDPEPKPNVLRYKIPVNITLGL